MARISGTVVPSLNLKTNPGETALEIGSNSRIVVQLLDVSLMDATSITLSEDVILTGDDQVFNFPIPFSLTYVADTIQPYQSLAIAVRVYDISSSPSRDEEGELTWISTSRHSVITNGNPCNNVEVEIDPVPKYDDAPITSKNTLTGQIKASASVPASSNHGVGPNAKIMIKLLDVSLMDAPSVTIGEQSIVVGAGEVIPFPIAFGILYDPKDIDDRKVYSVSVRVEELHSDNLFWISTWVNNVLTREAPTENVEIEIDQIK
ncbi:hypothetical protein KI688_005196 [Linnemannia hyalina]|uniref:Uncharacterized protein n=1 Tax=Linnemannia hyalina TaxID=64524 RepID=A0A9P8BNK5_9FUNG|nr:hypothetical protein KI688_005196 [Linnemannia hyalina]